MQISQGIIHPGGFVFPQLLDLAVSEVAGEQVLAKVLYYIYVYIN